MILIILMMQADSFDAHGRAKINTLVIHDNIKILYAKVTTYLRKFLIVKFRKVMESIRVKTAL